MNIQSYVPTLLPWNWGVNPIQVPQADELAIVPTDHLKRKTRLFKAVKKKLPLMNEAQFKEVFELAMNMNAAAANCGQSLRFNTKKSGCSTDNCGKEYTYQNLRDFKIDFISDPSQPKKVVVYINTRSKDANGLPLGAIEGSSRLCTKGKQIVFDFKYDQDLYNCNFVVKDVARKIINPSIIQQQQRYLHCLNNFLREVKFLNLFSKKAGFSQIHNSIAYTGSRDRKKITSYETLYRFSDLIFFDNEAFSTNLDEDKVRKKLIDLFVSLGRGMVELKQQKVIHNDIKLENISVDGKGRGYIRDFEFAEHDYLIETNKAYGRTADYLSPERFEKLFTHGYTSDAVSFASDMWAMGLVFYRIYTGVNPVWMPILRGMSELLKFSWRAKDRLTRMKEIHHSGYLKNSADQYNFVVQNVIDQEHNQTLRNLKSYTEKIHSTGMFSSVMSLPKFRFFEQNNNKQIFDNIDQLIDTLERCEIISGTICQMAGERSLKLDSFNHAIGVLEAIVKTSEELSNKMCSLLNNVWNRWSALPASEDLILRMIQDMLKINPNERITPQLLTDALDKAQQVN